MSIEGAKLHSARSLCAMPVPREIAAILQAGSLSKGYPAFHEKLQGRHRICSSIAVEFRFRKVKVSHVWVWKLKCFSVF